MGVLCSGTERPRLFALTSLPLSPQSYEVKSVLGKEVGPLTCFVRSLTTHPTSCVGLEEVELLSEGRASSEDWPRPQDL